MNTDKSKPKVKLQQYPGEIQSAKIKLEKFDAVEGYEKLLYIEDFTQAINSINDFIKENQKSSWIRQCENLKRSHTKRLLEFLIYLNLNQVAISQYDLFNLFNLFQSVVKEEIQYLLPKHSNLEVNYKKFFNTYSHVVKELIKSLEASIGL